MIVAVLLYVVFPLLAAAALAWPVWCMARRWQRPGKTGRVVLAMLLSIALGALLVWGVVCLWQLLLDPKDVAVFLLLILILSVPTAALLFMALRRWTEMKFSLCLLLAALAAPLLLSGLIFGGFSLMIKLILSYPVNM